MIPPQAATLQLLERALPEYAPLPAAGALERLARYLELVAEANARVRLVGSAELETLARRHLGESLHLAGLTELGGERLVDVGSGAGFPGLALALAHPELKTTLVEATGKKAAFLRQAVEALGLSGRVRIENQFLPRQPPRRGGGTALRTALEEAQLVTVRALEKMEELPAWLGRWMAPGAQAALWVTAALAAAWREAYPAWSWSGFHPLPGSEQRGILLGAPGGVFHVEQR